MQRCDFCLRWFRNKQATRAHLKWCKDYLDAKERGLVEPKELQPAEQPEDSPYETCAQCGAGFEILSEEVYGPYANTCPYCASAW